MNVSSEENKKINYNASANFPLMDTRHYGGENIALIDTDTQFILLVRILHPWTQFTMLAVLRFRICALGFDGPC